MPTEPSEAASAGAGPEKTASRPFNWRALGLIVLAGAASFALITLMPGLDTRTRVVLSFILAPVVVTPVFGILARFSGLTLIVGSVLGGEIAALLYAAGQYARFSTWLVLVEWVALLLALPTLRMLRMARIPGVPPGEGMPTPAGIVLMVVLSPFALAAALLQGMARYPIVALCGAVLASVITGIASTHPLEIIPVAIVVAALLALLPAFIRWLILRARQPHR
jgi:hypothetical protein